MVAFGFFFKNEGSFSDGDNLRRWRPSNPAYNSLIHLNIHITKVGAKKQPQMPL